MKYDKRIFIRGTLAVAALALVFQVTTLHAQDRLRVITTLTTYADIVRQIGGDRVDVTPIADKDENPHHVQPKPSLVMLAKRADMLVTTGLDLEMWLPSLMDKANNPRIASGTPGFVAVSPGIQLLDIPATLSRSEGESHVFGNHHIWTEPANGVVIGRNILAGLKRMDPDHAAEYDARYADWVDRLMKAYVGEELVDMLTTDVVVDLDRTGELWDFLNNQTYQGSPLIDRAGGWLRQTMAIRDQQMICYHKQWSYFTRSFGLSCAEYIEPRPGMAPTPRHVAEVIETIRDRNIPVLAAVTYYSRDQIQMVADRTGAKAAVVGLNVGAVPNTETFIDLVQHWVDAFTEAFEGS
jgi:ABC-type Zn uptake system ZnuABC Zn-binding protein ZnuA